MYCAASLCKKHLLYPVLFLLFAAIFYFMQAVPTYAAAIKDLDRSSGYARQSILNLADKNIINGNEKGYFQPKNLVSRAEMVTFIVNSLGIDTSVVPAKATFRDVPKGHWAFKYVEAAYRKGFVSGITPDTFGPDLKCTREQMAVMFVSSLQSDSDSKKMETALSRLDRFSDSNRISGWAREDVAMAIENGIMNGTGSNTFDPLQKSTREQTAVVTDHFIDPSDKVDPRIRSTVHLSAHEKGFVFTFTQPTGNIKIHRIKDDQGLEVKSSIRYLYGGSTVNNGIVLPDGKFVNAVALLTDVEMTRGKTYTVLYSFLTHEEEEKIERIVYDEQIVEVTDAAPESAYSDTTGMDYSTGNNVNYGYVAENSDWIFFTSPYDRSVPSPALPENRLYKVKKDGISLTALTGENVLEVAAASDWVYYVSYERKLYRIRTDGTGRMRLGTDIGNHLTVSGEWVYYLNYSDQGKLYRIKTDGTSKTKVMNDITSIYDVDGEWLYYNNQSDGWKLYKIKTDGSRKTKLSDDHARSINADNGWLYYVQILDDFDPLSNRIYRMRPDGTEKNKLNDHRTFTINVSDGWIYYSMQDLEKQGVYRMRPDGSSVTKLLNQSTDHLNVSNGFVFFANHNGDSYWRIRKNGTNPEWTGIGAQGKVPATVVPDPSPFDGKTITLGSTEDQVIRVMGHGSTAFYYPDIPGENRYLLTPISCVKTYRDGSAISLVYSDGIYVVTGWENKGMLKVRIGKGEINLPPFTMGSTAEEVAAAMGTPEYLSGNYWRYEGAGSISFGKDGRVSGWWRIDPRLNVSTGQKLDNASPFTVGSTRQEVAAAMGTPDSALRYDKEYNSCIEHWNYGESQVRFGIDGRVHIIINKGNLAVPETDPSTAILGIGSTEEDVKKAVGFPHRIEGRIWYYEDSQIRFGESGLVESIDNRSQNLRLCLTAKDPAAANFTRGSSMEAVARVMGPPTFITRYTPYIPSVSYTVWGFKGIASVYFNAKGKVEYWSDGFAEAQKWSAEPDAPPVTLDSSMEDIARILGQPDSLFWAYNTGLWQYGNSTVYVSREGKVVRWKNTDNLKISTGEIEADAPPFFLGSSLRDVSKVMGTPAEIREYNFTSDSHAFTVQYGTSLVYLDRNYCVSGWYNTGNLKTGAPGASSSDQPVTLGSSREEVVKTMGMPDSIYSASSLQDPGTVWEYGKSSLEFDKDGKIRGWNNAGELNLLTLLPEPDAPGITFGSSSEDVLKAMGTPQKVSDYVWSPVIMEFYLRYHQVWYYHDSFVAINSQGKVEAWYDKGALKLDKRESEPFSPPLRTGSSREAIQRALGTPGEYYRCTAQDFDFVYAELWKYGDSYLGVDENGNVQGWVNKGNLIISEAAADPSAPGFTTGSTREAVLKSMGTPSNLYAYKNGTLHMNFGKSSVVLGLDGRVVYYVNDGNLKLQLK
jgi:hypothetical protein